MRHTHQKYVVVCDNCKHDLKGEKNMNVKYVIKQ